ncbi:MAG TPA: GNAT family N-acetyltransferase [Anaerolineales bacterium]|nr:GNAT family N-acetyltransferase [Anaerolineales bacterium]
MAESEQVARPPFSVRPLKAADLDAVVKLHRAALGYSINCRLGSAHLSYLYSILRQDETCLATVAVSAGEVLGVVSAALDPEEFKRRLFAGLSFRRWAGLAGRLALHPGAWLEWYRSRPLERPVLFAGAEVRPCLTAIAVSPAARRTGVGRALVEAVDDFVRRHALCLYHLDTRANNSTSRAFYTRLGFLELEQRGRDVIFVRKL